MPRFAALHPVVAISALALAGLAGCQWKGDGNDVVIPDPVTPVTPPMTTAPDPRAFGVPSQTAFDQADVDLLKDRSHIIGSPGERLARQAHGGGHGEGHEAPAGHGEGHEAPAGHGEGHEAPAGEHHE